MVDALATLDPDLAARLREAPAQVQRRAAALAARWAIDHTGVSSPEIEAGLHALDTGEANPDVRAGAQRIADNLDEQYFQLTEQADGSADTGEDARHAFEQARAAAALAEAVSDDATQGALDAVYEASATVDDTTPLLDLVRSAL